MTPNLIKKMRFVHYFNDIFELIKHAIIIRVNVFFFHISCFICNLSSDIYDLTQCTERWVCVVSQRQLTLLWPLPLIVCLSVKALISSINSFCHLLIFVYIASSFLCLLFSLKITYIYHKKYQDKAN